MTRSSPLFIVGLPRSGTTLLAMILSAHSEIAVAPETHYFDRFLPYCLRHDSLSSHERFAAHVERFLGSLSTKEYRFRDGELGEITQTILRCRERSHRLVLDSLLSRYAANLGKPVWGEKTPVHYKHLNEIFQAFPEARIINIIRDPRDVLLSTEKTAWVSKDPITVARNWRMNSSIRESCRLLNGENFMECRYEDLLQDPEGSAKSLCSYLGIPFEPGMLSYAERGTPNFNPEKEPWKKKALEPIDERNREKWRKEMPLARNQVICLIVGKDLESRGYEIARPSVSFKALSILISYSVSHILFNLRTILSRLLRRR